MTVGAGSLAARTSDWIFPGTREWGTAIVRGLPIAAYMHHAFGTALDPAKGHSAPDHPPARAFRVAPASQATNCLASLQLTFVTGASSLPVATKPHAFAAAHSFHSRTVVGYLPIANGLIVTW